MWAVAFSMFIITKTRKKCKYLRLSVRADSFFVAKRGVGKASGKDCYEKGLEEKAETDGSRAPSGGASGADGRFPCLCGRCRRSY